MKKYITLAALLVAGSAFANAFDDTIWNFEGKFTSESGDGLHEVANPAFGKYENGSWSTTTATYEDSGLKAGTQIGNYTLNVDLGNAIVFSDGCQLKLGDSYWKDKLSPNKDKNQTESFTIMAYVKFDNISGRQTIFGTGDNGANGITFGLAGDTINFSLKNVSDFKTSQLELEADTWYNLALAYDENNNTAYYYLNGDLVDSKNLGDKSSINIGGSGSVVGSKGKDLGGDLLTGSIAQLKVLSGALAAKDILSAASLIPEPSTFGLLAGLGALALVGARRRRR